VQVEGNYSKDREGKPKTTHFTAKGLSKMGADEYMFDYSPNRDAEPVQISVANHFRDNLHINLQNPRYPCVVVRPRFVYSRLFHMNLVLCPLGSMLS
jgi:hypothetical protein